MKKGRSFLNVAGAAVLLILPAVSLLAGQTAYARYVTVCRQTLTLNRTAEYTIRFDGNFGNAPYFAGGTGSMADITASRGAAVTLPVNSYEKAGFWGITYTFLGWNTAPDGSGTGYSDRAEVRDIGGAWETVTLYAQWRENRGLGGGFMAAPAEGGSGEGFGEEAAAAGEETPAAPVDDTAAQEGEDPETGLDASGASYGGGAEVMTSGEVIPAACEEETVAEESQAGSSEEESLAEPSGAEQTAESSGASQPAEPEEPGSSSSLPEEGEFTENTGELPEESPGSLPGEAASAEPPGP